MVSKTLPLDKKIISGLFAKMQVRYGHKWTSQHTDRDLQRLALTEWADGLSGLTVEQIKTGLESWQGDWPPSLPEFYKSCLHIQSPSSNHGWLEYGSKLGIRPIAGEDWPSFIDRINACREQSHLPRLDS